MKHRRGALGAGFMALSVVSGCAAPREAHNIEPVATGGAYQAQYRAMEVSRAGTPTPRAPGINAGKCLPAAAGPMIRPAPAALRVEALSRGDLLDFRLPDETTFTGEYVVSRDGTLKLPFLPPIRAEGRGAAQVRDDIAEALVAGGYYDVVPDISLLVLDFAPVRVGVAGAVFEPQPVEIGGVQGDQLDSRRQAALGASTEGRDLSVALRAAGGVRPDADLSAVRIRRGGRSYALDLRGVTEGRAFEDVMLIAGDSVEVPSRGCFQDALMTPSPVSPPGISLYVSNLTEPATGNAPSAIGQEVRQVPYGTRFTQAVVNANCVGGTRSTSADRYAALFSRNPITDVSVVIDRPVEEMRARADRDEYDPYLLPGDAIACYDSGVTNLRDVARILGLFGAIAFIAP